MTPKTVVLELAQKMRDPNVVSYYTQKVEQEGRPFLTMSDMAISIASGLPGPMLFFAQLDECMPDNGWKSVAQSHASHLFHILRAAERGPQVGFGLMEGFTGLAFALDRVSEKVPALQSANNSLYESLITMQSDYDPPRTGHEELQAYRYDLVSGSVGIAAYHLEHLETERGDRSLDLVKKHVTFLVDLVCSHAGLTGYFLPVQSLASDRHRELYPSGCIDLGMAHGIAGVLGVLNRVAAIDIGVDGINQAIEKICRFLLEVLSSTSDDFWPNAFRAEGPSDHDSLSEGWWCYGTPGIALPLMQAGVVLGCKEWLDAGTNALERSCNVYLADGFSMRTEILCHGVAGMAQIIKRGKALNATPVLEQAYGAAIDRLVAMYDAAKPFGYRNPTARVLTGELFDADSVGLLDGAVGIGLVLMDEAFGQSPNWDRLLLTS